MKKPNIKLSITATALLAAFIYGTWAGFANMEYGTMIWLKAAIIQGGYAFISTLSITHIAKFVFLRFKCGISGILTGFTASFIVMVAIPFAVHTLAGTPDLWQTILPGIIWGSIYLASFLISLDFKMRILPQRNLKKSAEQQ